MRKIDHQNAMKKAEYEDQLRQQAKERNMQRDLELAKRQEELKRRKSTFLPLFDEQLSVFHVLPFFFRNNHIRAGRSIETRRTESYHSCKGSGKV